jgi:hypothetical protein
MSDGYAEFVQGKLATVVPTGLPDVGTFDYKRPLKPFHEALERWLLRRGRGAIFAGTGLGKSSLEVAFADQIVKATGGDVLIVAPLAVAKQTVREAETMGVEIKYCRALDEMMPGITITNYDMLRAFEGKRWTGVALDESSCLRNETGKTRQRIQAMFKGVPFKGSFSATPAPNDFSELGTQAEFLEVCTVSEMLATYFVHDGGSTQSWRLKGHAQEAFWRWVASWGALVTHPRDIGFDDGGYDLPPLQMHEVTVPVSAEDLRWLNEASVSQLSLFAQPALSLSAQQKAKRLTLERRCQAVADAVAREPDESWLVWVDLNDEGDLLEKLIEGSVQVAGSDKIHEKEDAALWFSGLLDGETRKKLRGKRKILISKASIFGFGLNFQACSRMVFVGPTHKWESVFQAIRRCYRFGQTRPVQVHIVSSELESKVLENFWSKEHEARELTEHLRSLVGAYVREEVSGNHLAGRVELGKSKGELPSWLVTLPGDPVAPTPIEPPSPEGRLHCAETGWHASAPPAWLRTLGGAP